MDVFNLGRNIRNHKFFKPAGTNVNFVEVLGDNEIRIRTYERGVEDETLACGTGTTASAIISALRSSGWKDGNYSVKAYTRGGEVLKVCFNYNKGKLAQVWLEGKAQIVYKGEYYV